jgi:hypothetical protein
MRAINIGTKLSAIYIMAMLTASIYTLISSVGFGHRLGTTDYNPKVKAGLEILASSQYLPTGGNTVQLRALLNHADGTSEDVTKEVTWTISNRNVGAISSEGSFKSSQQIGSTIVLATFENVFAGSTTVVVVGTMTQASFDIDEGQKIVGNQ